MIEQPLATRLRPKSLDDIVGHEPLLGSKGTIRNMVITGHLQSLIFWGPPGVGKTTLAEAIGRTMQAQWIPLSAVNAGVKDIRNAVDAASDTIRANIPTIVFIDEIHRFNKTQQDALLPHVESGLLTLLGATTENPSFALNNALLSRTQVIVLEPLSVEDLMIVFERAQTQLGDQRCAWPESCIKQLISWADGDTRRLLNAIQHLSHHATTTESAITSDMIAQQLGSKLRHFDKGGDHLYDQISALHKSIRGSAPDGALYWLCRMLDGGVDPHYIARRLIRMASEDIGNADPRALQLCINAWETQERLGSPEGELTLAQAVLYLAAAPKSNAVYTAFKACMQTVKQGGTDPVPPHLRNAPTSLAKAQGFGSGYRYAHDEPNGYAAGECYLPPSLQHKTWYKPVDRGLEQRIKAKLDHLKSLDQHSSQQRYQTSTLHNACKTDVPVPNDG